ncbi:MAG: hypothetical protein JSU98_13905, partial [Gemmatimonadales bacterium]
MVVRIHPGQSSTPLRVLTRLLLLLHMALPAASSVAGQAQEPGSPRDSLQVLDDARDAQARFERTRRR